MRSQRGSKFRLIQFKWIFWTNAIVVIGSVMAFGLVARIGLNLNNDNAIVMLCMIPLMTVATICTTAIILYFVRKRMSALLNGIQMVAEGDLEIQLDMKDAGEYQPIYEDLTVW